MSTDHFETDGAKTKQNEIVVLSPQPHRRAFNGQYRPSASFVAQVIAAKTGAPTYRQKTPCISKMRQRWHIKPTMNAKLCVCQWAICARLMLKPSAQSFPQA